MTTDTATATTSSVNATAQFYQRSTGVRLFRTALTSAQSLWPTLAERMAKRLFLTPLPPKWLQRNSAWAVQWHIERWAFERASVTVYRHQNSAACDAHAEEASTRPHVLLMHGWGGHAAQMLPLADALVEQGMVPVIIEAPGHGRSAGNTATLPQFARAMEYVAARLREQGVSLHAIIAHSLGGSAGARVVARGLPTQGLVLIAAPDAPRDYTRMFAQVFGLSEPTRAAMQRRIEAQEGMLMEQFDAAQSAPNVQVPTLVVHDVNDAINTFAGAERFMRYLPHARLLRTEGLGHRKILKDAETHAQIVKFLMRLV